MSRKTWAAPSLTCGRRVRSEPVPRMDERHPEPTQTERMVLRVVRVFEQVFPALARAYPDKVDDFQAALEQELEGRPRTLRRRRTPAP